MRPGPPAQLIGNLNTSARTSFAVHLCVSVALRSSFFIHFTITVVTTDMPGRSPLNSWPGSKTIFTGTRCTTLT